MWNETDNCWYHGTIGNLYPIPKGPPATVKILFTCAASVVIGDWVVASQTASEQVEAVGNNTYSDLVIGAVCDKPSTTTCNVAVSGVIDGYSGLTQGKRVFIGASGLPTTTKPATGNLQVVGTAISASKILIDVSRVKVVQS